MTLAPGDPRHGTHNGYGNLGCRCPECTTAHTQYKAALRLKAATERTCPNCHGPAGLLDGGTCYACDRFKKRYGFARVVDPVTRRVMNSPHRCPVSLPDVTVMHAMWTQGLRQADIARHFGVTTQAVSLVLGPYLAGLREQALAVLNEREEDAA